LLWNIAKDLFWVQLCKLPSLDHPKVPELVDNLIKLNKIPDFVLDKGHTFGYEEVKNDEGQIVMHKLSVQERLDLIEFLKTM